MKAETITEEQIQNLQIGTSINFGDDRIYVFNGIKDGYTYETYDGKGGWKKEVQKLALLDNGQDHKEYSLHVLQGATFDLHHFMKCEYCGALRPREEMKIGVKIFVNHGTRYHNFCADDHCAGNYQMGCEG